MNESFDPFQLDDLAWYERDGVHVVNDLLLLHVGVRLRFELIHGFLVGCLGVESVLPSPDQRVYSLRLILLQLMPNKLKLLYGFLMMAS